MAEPRRRYAALTAGAGLRLEGIAVRYGELSTAGDRIVAGAFGDVSTADVVLTAQHDRGAPLARTGGGGLVLVDSPEALRIEADLPDTPRSREVHTLVAANILRGLSIEYHPVAEHLTAHGDDQVLEVTAARLPRLSVVDSPAFESATVEARADNDDQDQAPRRRRRWWL